MFDCLDPNKINFVSEYEMKRVLTSKHYLNSPGEVGVPTESFKLVLPQRLSHIINIFNRLERYRKRRDTHSHSRSHMHFTDDIILFAPTVPESSTTDALTFKHNKP